MFIIEVLSSVIFTILYLVMLAIALFAIFGLFMLLDSVKKNISSFFNPKSSDRHRVSRRGNRQNVLPSYLSSWLCMRGDEVIMTTQSIEEKIKDCSDALEGTRLVIRTGFLQGLPGRGKTVFATLLKKELEKRGKSVIYQSSPSAVGNLYMNSGVEKLRDRFNESMRKAEDQNSQYVIMAVEEADTVIKKASYKLEEKTDMLNFYKSLADYNDEISSSEIRVPGCVEKVLILFTTNLKMASIDDAVLDRSIFTVANFDPFTDDERKAIWLINYLHQRNGLSENLNRNNVIQAVSGIQGIFSRNTSLRKIASEADSLATRDSSSKGDPFQDGIRQLTASVRQ